MTRLYGFESLAEPNVDHALAVGTVYDLLSQLWMRELDGELLAVIRQPTLEGALQDLGLIVPSESVEELATEYCRLFIGPREHSPPIQSVWQQAQLGSASVASVKKFAELVGYPIPSGVIEDHLAIELAVMSRLVASTVSSEPADRSEDGLAVTNGQTGEAASDAASMFFQRHLDWAAPFFLAINQRAELDFYRSLADVTQQFLRLERAFWLQPRN